MIGGIIGGAAGALGGIFGSFSKNKALRKQQQMLDKERQENQDWFDRRYNEDVTQRADAQALLTNTAEMIRKRNQQLAGATAVAGGTDESAAAAKEANAKALADATGQIAATADQRKDRIESTYNSRNSALNEKQRELEWQKQNGMDVLSNAVGGAINGVARGEDLD
ncbi:hypothetical protein [Alloprevotella tannerae]|uniref:hypothetical protein n=1 Tax=Alloprevotella tannerae TaxID=76122 RepID=UPI00288AF34C|nr:hypothetical protein [Alloprevotella tannerae]